MRGPINVILADDHKMFIDGLTSILQHECDCNILFSANNGWEIKNFLESNENTRVDLVIMDLDISIVDGVSLNHFIKNNSYAKTLILSTLANPQKIKQLVDDGLDGYLSKNATKRELLVAVDQITQGIKHFSKDIKERYAEGVIYQKENRMPLTKRETQILQLIAEEYTTQEIATQLFLSKYTIEGYRSSLFSKLNVKNVVGLAKHAVKMGLVQ